MQEENKIVRKIGGMGLAAVMAVGTLGSGVAPAMADETVSPGTPASGDSTTPAAPKVKAAYGKQTVEFKEDSTGTYKATIDKYAADPLKTVAVTIDGSTSTATLEGTPSLSVTHPKVGVSRLTGTVTYKGTVNTTETKTALQTHPIELTVNVDETYGIETKLADGTPFVTDGGKATATLNGVTLNADGTPSQTQVTLSDGTKADIAWADPAYSYKDGYTVTRTGTATATVGTKDYDWQTGQKTKAYQWNLTVNAAASTTASWKTSYEGKDVLFSTSGKDGTQTAAMTGASIPDKLTVKGENGKDVTLDNPTITPTGTTGTDRFGVMSETGTAEYARKAEGVTPGFSAKVSYTKTYGTETTLKDGTKLAVQADGKTAMTETHSDEYRADGNRVVDKDGNEVKEIELSDGTKLPVEWTASTDAKTHVTNIRGVTSHAYTVTDPQTGAKHEWTVKVTQSYQRTDTWQGELDGTTFTFSNDPSTGSQSHTVSKTVGKLPGTIAVTPSDKTQAKFDLTPNYVGTRIESGEKLGTATVSGTATYHRDAKDGQPAFDVTIPYSYQTGSEITIDNGSEHGIAFTKADDGTYRSDYSEAGLSDANKPSYDEVKLSDGSKAKVAWQDKANSILGADQKTRIVVLPGTAEGILTVDDGHGNTVKQKYAISTRDVRPEDTSFTKMTLTQTSADGKTKSYDITKDDFDANRQKTVELDASAAKDSFTLSAEHGVDAQVSRPKLSVDGTSRIITVNVNGEDYTVRVNFKTSDIQPDSPAKLTGIYVNLTGKAEKGTLIDNWDPNRLDYVVALKDANTNAYLLPEAPAGVTVKAGNVTQSAQSSRQEWIVTDTATGASRTYSVTVTRPVKTAVTEFQPKEPVEQSPTKTPDSPSDTNLASVGYVDRNGKYVPVSSNRFEIPEGGTFSYETKTGQSAVVSSSHEGMTYTYTVSVLSPDGATFTQHDYTVTYITAATHKAVLTGIAVDGKLVNGFSPDKTSYEVAVDNPDRWTVVGQYDKDSGMSITIDKNGADATLTVTSGDGLVSKDYRVHVTKKPFGGAGTVGVGDLAQTGVNTGIIGLAVIVLVAIGGVLAFVSRKLHRRRKDDADATPENAPDTGEDGNGEESGEKTE